MTSGDICSKSLEKAKLCRLYFSLVQLRISVEQLFDAWKKMLVNRELTHRANSTLLYNQLDLLYCLNQVLIYVMVAKLCIIKQRILSISFGINSLIAS